MFICVTLQDYGHLAVASDPGRVFTSKPHIYGEGVLWHAQWAGGVGWVPGQNWQDVLQGGLYVEGRVSCLDDGSRVLFKGSHPNLAQENCLYEFLPSMASPPPPARIWPSSAGDPRRIAGNVVARGGTEAIFIDFDGKLHRVVRTGTNWAEELIHDFNTSSGLPLHLVGMSLAAVPSGSRVFFVNPQRRLAYVELQQGTWVTVPIEGPGTPPNYQYGGGRLLATENDAVYFVGRDRRLHRYVYYTGAWHFQPMTHHLQTPPRDVSFHHIAKFPGEERIFYKDSSWTIWNVYQSFGDWVNHPLAATQGQVAGDLCAVDARLWYVAKDGSIHNTYWDGGRWVDGQLTSNSTSTYLNTSPYRIAYYHEYEAR